MIERFTFELFHCNGGYMTPDAEGEYVSYEDYAELQQKLDALAAELNNVREQAENVYAAGYQHGHLNTVDGIAYATPVEDEFYHNALQVILEVETPATDAYMNSVRAEGADAVAAYHKDRAEALIAIDRNGANDHKVSYMAARDVAAQLRSGTHDTADKAG